MLHSQDSYTCPEPSGKSTLGVFQFWGKDFYAGLSDLSTFMCMKLAETVLTAIWWIFQTEMCRNPFVFFEKFRSQTWAADSNEPSHCTHCNKHWIGVWLHLETLWNSDSELFIPDWLHSSRPHWQTDVSVSEISSCGVPLKTHWCWKLWLLVRVQDDSERATQRFMVVSDWRAGWQEQEPTTELWSIYKFLRVWTPVNVKNLLNV